MNSCSSMRRGCSGSQETTHHLGFPPLVCEAWLTCVSSSGDQSAQLMALLAAQGGLHPSQTPPPMVPTPPVPSHTPPVHSGTPGPPPPPLSAQVLSYTHCAL